jgi:predicted RNA-binding Zn ribbon-like protein
MSRPLKKRLFGNTNFGVAGTTSDDGLGGGRIASITQDVKGSPNLTGTLTVTIDAPDEPGGVQATATATVSAGDVTFVVTNPGSGYRSIVDITVTSTSGQNAGRFGISPLGYDFATAVTGGVEHIRITANVLGLTNNTADIVRQMSSRKFLVKNANGVAVAKVHPAGAYYGGNLPTGFMIFYATDNASARYIVSKISAHRVTIVQDPTSSGWLFASGTSVRWRRASGADGARTNADVYLDTLLN